MDRKATEDEQRASKKKKTLQLPPKKSSNNSAPRVPIFRSTPSNLLRLIRQKGEREREREKTSLSRLRLESLPSEKSSRIPTEPNSLEKGDRVLESVVYASGKNLIRLEVQRCSEFNQICGPPTLIRPIPFRQHRSFFLSSSRVHRTKTRN